MAAINVSGVFGADTSELTISGSQVTISKRFHTIAAAVGTVGTIQTVALDSGVGTQLNGSLTDVYLRPKAGHFIAIQHAVPGTNPVYMAGSQTINLNETQTLHLVQNFGGNSWLAPNGINLPTAGLVDLTSVQTLTNKTLSNPTVSGSLTHQGIVAGFSGASSVSAQIGTTVVGVATGTAVSISLAEGQSMRVKATVLAAKTDHSEALHSEITGLYRRISGGTIVQVGTTTPQTIGTSALAISLGIDTSAQVANILATGISGTSIFKFDYQFTKITAA